MRLFCNVQELKPQLACLAPFVDDGEMAGCTCRGHTQLKRLNSALVHAANARVHSPCGLLTGVNFTATQSFSRSFLLLAGQ